MFQFGGFPTLNYGFIQRSHGITREGFPHSDICGSQAICASPQLFAAYRVLLRLLMPRHSPCALISLTIFWFSERIMQVTEDFSRSICSFYPINSTKKLFASLFSEAPSVALLFTLIIFRCSVFKVQAPVKDRIKTLKHL